MDSELQDAIERIDAAQLGGESLDDEPEYRAVELVTNTARKYANPDYKAVADALDGGMITGPFEWRINQAKRLVNLALGVTEAPDGH